MSTEYVSLNTLIDEIDNKYATLSVEYNTYFGGCTVTFKSLDICIDDIYIVFRDKLQEHTNDIKIDINTVLNIEKLSSYGYKIHTDDCQIEIQL